MTEGWICSYRAIWDHPIFESNAERVGVWDWMLKTCAWKTTRFNAGAEVITLERGQLCVSQAQVTKATGISRQKFRTFLSLLEKEGAISISPATKSTKGRTLITICKYDKYQAQQPKANQAATKEQPTKEQGNNIPVGEAEKSASVDPSKIIFGQGLSILKASGKSDGAARAILGKWRRDHTDGDVIAALGQCQREGAVDPVSYCEGVFRFSKKRNAVERQGYVASGAFGNIREVC